MVKIKRNKQNNVPPYYPENRVAPPRRPHDAPKMRPAPSRFSTLSHPTAPLVRATGRVLTMQVLCQLLDARFALKGCLSFI